MTVGATMTAASLTAPDTFELQELPVPEVPLGWALLRVELTGLCGTDFSIVHGTHPRAEFPLVVGHEITGRVVHAPGGELSAGTRVVVEPLITCGECRPCREGAAHVCQNLRLFGIDAPGSFAEYVALPVSALLPVDESVPLREVALAEPLAVAVHAVASSGIAAGEDVLVFGAGPIGVLTALVARLRGAGTVTVVEPSAERRAIATELGFTTLASDGVVEAVAAATDGRGADVVFDTAGAPPVAAVLAQCTRVQGRIVLVGVYKAPAALDLQRITFGEMSLVGVRVYTRADVLEAVEIIESRSLPLGQLPVQTFGLDRAAEAMQLASSSPRALKVFVGPGEGAA